MTFKLIYKFFAAIMSVLIMLILGFTIYIQSILPDSFYIVQGQNLKINSKFPIVATCINRKFEPQAYDETPGNTYKMDLKLLGGVNIKQVNVQVVERKLIVPAGTPFGIKMFTQGVMVVGFSDVSVNNQMVNPAKLAGLKAGDIVLEMDGRKINSNEDLINYVTECNGNSIQLRVRRKDTILVLNIKPVLTPDDNAYKVGMWVRDSSAGIGTMTFYDPETKSFGGLGHAICDIDTGDIMPLQSGEIVNVTITGVTKGVSGTPGELRGKFNSAVANGSLQINNETGVFGIVNTPPTNNQAIPLAVRSEIVCGKAKVLTTINSGPPQLYDAEIEKINYSDANPTKNMVIRITDPKLLAETGGIVQGMSGSPIIQNGMLIGAVTHVFVNDPTRGYGIFAENMEKSTAYLKPEYKNNNAA